MTGKRVAMLVAVTVALAGGLTVATWASTRLWGDGLDTATGHSGNVGGMMNGAGMMNSGLGGLSGDGRPVASLDAARQRAQVFADRLGLNVGEVMRFSNGYYAELRTADGAGATEVLIDASSGAVTLEFGPAMMWNTAYGMHAGAATATTVSPIDAQKLAQRWLDANRAGLTAGEPETFPGYVTLHTMRHGAIVGMMSVNTSTGAVWYHTWHGSFVEMDEG